MRWAMLIDEIHDALRPSSTPVSATLSELGAVSEGFLSKSSVCPVTIIVVYSEDWGGDLAFDIKLDETWYPIYPDSDPILIPEGCEIRARLRLYTAGSVVVKIFQGRTS